MSTQAQRTKHQSTITAAQQKAIRAYFKGRDIPAGLGDAEHACSIAGINLALSGTLTANIPDCMSPVVGSWIIGIQDAMPHAMRNSAAWRRLLPLAAGTGRTQEARRMSVILNWLFGAVLPQLQHIADAGGYGAKWHKMCADRTAAAARGAAYAAARVAYAAVYAAADAARAATNAAADAAYAAYAAVYAAPDAAARAAANAAADAAARAADAAFWNAIDPCALLRALIETTP